MPNIISKTTFILELNSDKYFNFFYLMTLKQEILQLKTKNL